MRVTIEEVGGPRYRVDLARAHEEITAGRAVLVEDGREEAYYRRYGQPEVEEIENDAGYSQES